MKNKKILIISACVGLLVTLSLILFSYLSGELTAIKDLMTDDAKTILLLTFLIPFAGTFFAIKLLFQGEKMKKWLFVCLVVLGFGAFFAYQKGYIGSHTITALFNKKVVNPYTGIYAYDKSKIINPKILNSVTIAEENGYERLTLVVKPSMVTFLGYQFQSAVRNRFFIACLSDGVLQLYSWTLDEQLEECKIPEGKQPDLTLKPVDNNTLFCENCESQEFPNYWIKQTNEAKP